MRDGVGVEASSLSQHLTVLKQSGLVTSRRRGNQVSYRITDDSVADFLAAARRVMAATMGHTRRTLEDLESRQ